MEFKHKPNPTHTQILIQVRVLPLDTQILGTQSPPYYLQSIDVVKTTAILIVFYQNVNFQAWKTQRGGDF